MADKPVLSDAELFARRGFGLRIGFGNRPALIIIDMANAFTDEKAMLGSNLDAQITATVPILEAAHARDVPVFFSTVRYDDREMRDAGVWASKQRGLRTLTADMDGWKIDQRLDFRPTDTLLVKKYASCFFGTDLGSRLVAQGVDTLIITGCTTSGCVRATAVDAVQYGFRPMVVREAVGDRSDSAHSQSLFDLDAKYADVVGLDDTVQYLNTFGHNSR
jgi:maleamate amidohydrolase